MSGLQGPVICSMLRSTFIYIILLDIFVKCGVEGVFQGDAIVLTHYKLRRGDCPGYDIRRISPATQYICRDACDSDPLCHAFLYVPYLPLRSDSPYCILKEKTCIDLQRPEVYFHYYDKFMTLANYTGRMRGCDAPTLKMLWNQTLVGCKEECDITDECQGFAFIKHDNKPGSTHQESNDCDLKSDYCSALTSPDPHTQLFMKSEPPGIRQVPNVDCIIDEAGKNYQGRVNAVRGVKCMRWDQTKEAPRLSDWDFPERSMKDASNFCRTPMLYSARPGPYCYLNIDNMQLRRKCNISLCTFANETDEIYNQYEEIINEDCRTGTLGLDYTGRVNVSARGNACVEWSLFQQYSTQNFPDWTVTDASNYCRNPNKNQTGLWCFTTRDGSTRERCNVELCPQIRHEKYCKHSYLGEDFHGVVNKSVDGELCIPWKDARQFVPTSLKTTPDNYCRNLDYSAMGPWCYVSPTVRKPCPVEYCDGFIPVRYLEPRPLHTTSSTREKSTGVESNTLSQTGSVETHGSTAGLTSTTITAIVVPTVLGTAIITALAVALYKKKRKDDFQRLKNEEEVVILATVTVEE